ncbi:radical SAM protein [Spirosoma sp. HMF3257]|uniref:Radical SAM protein n=1 Tax=Spirosoma telluris TaxID=2183553 RepID=A0A327NRM2_9BACT|nr:radical SAM protein [Spirosoma telluris]RAI78041.1 radical SAM protein [Spirosoma telluris]
MGKANKVILFNPLVTKYKARIPLSILQVAASIYGNYEFVLVDGNREDDPWSKIKNYLNTGEFHYFGCTVMPGPQLRQAIPFTKRIKEEYPDITIIWGGYFASNQYKVCMESGYVDYIINGIGDLAFPALLDALENSTDLFKINNLIFRKNEELIKTHKITSIDMDSLKTFPYQELERFYPITSYFGKTHLGLRTTLYHSSFGCPFTCSFCGIVPIFEARWKGMSAERLYREIKYLKDEYGVDSVEFCDNNFFVSEKRVRRFCELIQDEHIKWWGEARIDTLDKFSDETLSLMENAGCKMIFLGAETGNEETLKAIDKGGTQNASQMIRFAARMKRFNIIPEYSFVLGFPAETPQKVMAMIDEDINFIKQVKEANPDTEIIIYVYSPVLTEGSDLYESVKASGFQFPEKLDDWLDQEWKGFDLRKNPLTPWLTAKMINKIRNFEVVLNARYPTAQDVKLSKFQRKTISLLSQIRYKTNFFNFPYELKFLLRFWLRYRQPEIEGATML